GLDRERAPLASHPREQLAGGKQEPLGRVGAVGPREVPAVPTRGQPVGARALLLAHAARKVVCSLDAIQHDGSVANGGADELVAVVGEGGEESLESLVIEEPHAPPPAP